VLVLDVGNTNKVLGLHVGRWMVAHWRVSTNKSQTVDEYGVLFQSLFAAKRVRSTSVTGIMISSVVPPVESTLCAGCEEYFHLKPLFVEPGIKTGMPVHTDNPNEVGADRIVNGVAAFEKHGGPCIVVDFGTSTNFDAVSARGEFLGGALAPGVEISIDALATRAAQLVKVQLVRPRSVIGKSTVEALQSGLLFGFAGQVEGIVRRLRDELGASTTVIATGGLADLIVPHTKLFAARDERLVLDGIYHWALTAATTAHTTNVPRHDQCPSAGSSQGAVIPAAISAPAGKPLEYTAVAVPLRCAKSCFTTLGNAGCAMPTAAPTATARPAPTARRAPSQTGTPWPSSPPQMPARTSPVPPVASAGLARARGGGRGSQRQRGGSSQVGHVEEQRRAGWHPALKRGAELRRRAGVQASQCPVERAVDSHGGAAGDRRDGDRRPAQGRLVKQHPERAEQTLARAQHAAHAGYGCIRIEHTIVGLTSGAIAICAALLKRWRALRCDVDRGAHAGVLA